MESMTSRWFGILRFSARQLRHRWLESLFILLGIALGVGVFTDTVTYVRFNERLTEQMRRSYPQLGAVRVKAQTFDLTSFYQSDTPATRLPAFLEVPVHFDLDSLQRFREELPIVDKLVVSSTITRISPIQAVDGENVFSADPASRLQLAMRRISPDEPLFAEWKLLAGSYFTWEDVREKRPVLLLDEESASTLFPNFAPEQVVGRTITAGLSSGPLGSMGTVWTITGVVEKREQHLMLSTGPTVQAFVPLGAFDAESYSEFFIVPRPEASINDAIREVQAYVDQIYGAGQVEVRPPSVTDATNREFIVAFLMLAGMALLIAAVSILNLFTARVLRRQRYTGMSIALGATRSTLFWQTALEVLLLGVLGSLLGLLVAHGLIKLLVQFLMTNADPQTRVEYAKIGITAVDALVGLGIGTGVSLLFGLYPGFLAARQEPPEALRVE